MENTKEHKMRECFNHSCNHYGFKGKHIKCRTCPEVMPKPTGETCIRCGNEIERYVGTHWGGCVNYACLECTKLIQSLPDGSIGMTTDVNIRYCYWLETGNVMPLEIAQEMIDVVGYDDLTPEQKEYYDMAIKAFNRMEKHSMLGGVWLK